VSEQRGFSPDAQRYLDGEPHGELDEAEGRRADALARAGFELAARLASPAASLDERVMAAVHGQPRPRRSVLAWWLTPQPVRLRPIYAGLAAAAVLALILMPRRSPVAPAPSVVAAETVFVHFQLVAPQAQRVSVAGSFNDWREEGIPLRRDARGTWTVTVPLAAGEHRYLFQVDGAWVSDPLADAQVPDDFGGTNSLIVVGPPRPQRT
jgi:hypothetical protein